MPRVEYSLHERKFMYDNYVLTNSPAETRRRFQARFPDITTPNKKTIHRIVNKFRCTGSLLNKKYKRDCSVLTEQKLDEIGARIEQSPRKSLKRLAQETGISKSTAGIASKRLRLKPYRDTVLIEPVIVQEINNEAENTTDANNDFDTEEEEVHKRKPEEHLDFSLPKRLCVQTKDQEDPKNLDPSKKKLRDDCRIFGEHVANKLSTYNSRIQAIVQHQINNILFEADMGRYSHSVPEQWSASPASSPSPRDEETVLASSPASHTRQETSSNLQLALPHSSASQPYAEVVKEEERVLEQHLPHSESPEEEMIPELRSPRHLDTNTELHGTDNSICNESYNKAVESHLQTICDTVSKLTGKRPSLQKENEFDIFGRSVAIQLQTLPFVIALETQLKLQSILTEMRLKTNYCESVSLRNGIPTIVAPT